MSLFLALTLSLSAYGAKVTYPSQRLFASDVKRIEVSGVKGNVKLLGRSSRFFNVKVRHSRGRKFEDWSLLVDRRGSTLVFEVSSILYGAQWRKAVRKEDWPEFDIEISGPPRETSISWRDGRLEVQNWTASVESSQLSGQVRVKDSIGDFKISLSEGDVQIQNLVGPLQVQGEKGEVDIRSLRGPLKLQWVKGTVNVKGAKGGGLVDVNEGRLKMSSCLGRWDVKLERGQAALESVEGHLLAEGKSAAWALDLNHRVDSEIKSETGPVRVRWRQGGAKVFLTSDRGGIQGQGFVPKVDAEGRNVVDFKVKGKALGQVFVKTVSGPIRFEQ